MELMHAAATAGSTCVGGGGGSLAAPQTTNSMMVPSSGAAGNATTATMLPIMVIPTAMMPPGTHLINATTTNNPAGDCDNQEQQTSVQPPPTHAHFYQLQPTHILATATPSNTDFTLGSTPTAALLLQPASSAAAAGAGNAVNLTTNTNYSEQLPQQIPQQHMLNILYTGTLKPTMKQSYMNDGSGGINNITATSSNPLCATRSTLECATLPRNFQPTALSTKALSLSQQQDESDFEGSECGASVSTTTCIPHFRFGGCGVILQPAQNINAHSAASAAAAAAGNAAAEPQVIGCASLSHMMGTFASAAGDAMHSGGRNLAGTLGRNRRSHSSNTGTSDQITQTPKRVSFKGVDLPPPSPEELQILDASHGGVHNMDTFNNCSYMNFDHFMDYQVME